jgi:hypothetical protein
MNLYDLFLLLGAFIDSKYYFVGFAGCVGFIILAQYFDNLPFKLEIYEEIYEFKKNSVKQILFCVGIMGLVLLHFSFAWFEIVLPSEPTVVLKLLKCFVYVILFCIIARGLKFFAEILKNTRN